MSLLTKGIRNLSELVIDTNKDWLGHSIKNIGAPPADADVLSRGLVDVYSSDRGLNWHDLGVISTMPITCMAYLGNGIAVMGDSNWNVYRSTDYGVTWTDLGTTASMFIRSMAYLGNGIAILGDTTRHVYRSTDYGVTWVNLGVIASDAIWAMAYLGNGIAILGDFTKHVYRSTSAFQLWRS
jgi:hypothetical protein